MEIRFYALCTDLIYNLLRARKYQNPHHNLHEEPLRIVSRNDLASESEERADTRKSNIKTENDPALDEAMIILEELLHPLAADFASATRSRKRKCNGSLVSTMNANQATEIRLVSQNPTVVYTSEPADGWPSQPKTHPSEDTSEEAKERKRRAGLVAVDFELIRKQSAIPYSDFRAVATPKYKLKDKPTLTTVAVIECPKPKKSRSIHPPTEPSHAKIREPKVKKSLIVDVRSSYPILPKLRSDLTPHTFYHSGEAVGGKSAGYAWGYRGSIPRPVEITGYLRDNMRKGLDMAVVGREACTTQALEANMKPTKTRRKQS